MIYNIEQGQYIELQDYSINVFNLKDTCGFCGSPDCFFNCDMSQADENDLDEVEQDIAEDEEKALQRVLRNAAIDGMTELLHTMFTSKQAMPSETTVQETYQRILEDF